MKNVILKLSTITFIFMALLCFFSACNNGQENGIDTTITLPAKEVPSIVEQVTATPIIVGESTNESELGGKFSVEGTLLFTDDSFKVDKIGTTVRSWEFIPNDTEKYDRVNGEVNIKIYNYKIDFEENGGFEISNIYFDESYTITDRPMTAKNEYKFDGWSLNDDTSYIAYPITFSETTTLYAGYRFHTASKLSYFTEHETRAVVTANWNKYLDSFDPLNEHHDWPHINSSNKDNLIANSIEGEVLIADMYNDVFIQDIDGFLCTRITGIELNNYISRISREAFVCSTIEEIVVPNTVTTIGTSAFMSSKLRSIIFEDGKSPVEPKQVDGEITKQVLFEYKERELYIWDAFTYCYDLEEVKLSRVKNLGMASFGWSGIESITIPKEVEKIQLSAFQSCAWLKEVIFEEGSNLQFIDERAFGLCLSLKEIEIPNNALVSPAAFYGCSSLMNIGMSDEQIENMAKHLHESYIGENDNFEVEIVRDEEYSGTNCRGEYVAGSEKIKLWIDDFSIAAISALCYEFFHHYQYVVCYGVGNENIDCIPAYTDKYFYYRGNLMTRPPIMVITSKIDAEAMKNLKKDRSVYEVNDEVISSWKETYIPPSYDYEAYWNQPFEKDARMFSYWFTNIEIS